MFSSIRFSGTMFHFSRCLCILAVVASLGLAGCHCLDNCSGVNLCGDGFDETAEPFATPSMRMPDQQSRPFALTNKGMQIERSLGAGGR